MTTIPEPYRDLLDAPVATLATNNPDGYPQVSAVWFLAEGGSVRLSLNTGRWKTKNLQRDPRATLFVLDPANPGRYLEIRADVTIEPDDDYAFATKVGAKYGGVDLRMMDKPGESRVVVTLRPVKVNAVSVGG
jgi:PPOX class probable F420-dependent enzyme